jgi:hydrogenase expression/formation protein HypD
MFQFLARDHGIPCVVVGFTPTDVLRGVVELVNQRRDGRAAVVNLYSRVVTPGGNAVARALVDRFMEPADVPWRGLGVIPGSGLAFRREWAHRDAENIDVAVCAPVEPRGCRCGEVLRGTIDPPECTLFGRTCTPDRPIGACMVSNEGTCAAWYRHQLAVPA